MALLLAIIPAWLLLVWDHESRSGVTGELMLYTLWFSVVMMALSSFGREFGLKTFPLLLSQPMDRRRIWRTKTSVLAGFTLLVMGVWALAIAPLFIDPYCPLPEMPMVVAGVAAAFSGGLWAALLLRQVAAAFWFTLLAPCTILMVIWVLNGPELLAYAIIMLYSIGGFLWAGWLFTRAQEVGWTGGLVDFSSPRAMRTTQQQSSRAWVRGRRY